MAPKNGQNGFTNVAGGSGGTVDVVDAVEVGSEVEVVIWLDDVLA